MTEPAIVMIGCGRMGGAILRGLAAGPPREIWVVDPHAPAQPGARFVASLQDLPALVAPTVVVAVKPQVAGEVLPHLAPVAREGALAVSIVAGLTLATLARTLPEAGIVRAMPNTPAAVLKGVTGAAAGPRLTHVQRARAQDLLAAVGEVVWLDDEALIEAVTAISGSGPAYFFRFAEALSAAGRALGLPEETAERLARRTLEGAGALAGATDRSLAELRAEVTSPGGTTAAGLERLDDEDRIDRLLLDTARAARARSEALGRTIG